MVVHRPPHHGTAQYKLYLVVWNRYTQRLEDMGDGGAYLDLVIAADFGAVAGYGYNAFDGRRVFV